MKVGGKRPLTIPLDMGYGSRGADSPATFRPRCLGSGSKSRSLWSSSCPSSVQIDARLGSWDTFPDGLLSP